MCGAPFFVYGTLMVGECNRRLLEGRVRGRTAGELGGALLFHGPGVPYPYPYAVPDPAGAGTVCGEVVEIEGEAYEQVVAELDRLEGYVPGGPPGLYDRVLRTVRTPAGPVDAWVYLAVGATARELLRSGVRIGSGDWRRRRSGPHTPGRAL